MSTIEEKQKLQRDAGLSNLPTDLTYDLRRAIGGEGDWAYQWQDKPHRLVYTACSQVELLTVENAQLAARVKAQEEAMAKFCRRVDAGEIRSRNTYAEFKALLTPVPKEKSSGS